jgi:hypothetical protein
MSQRFRWSQLEAQIPLSELPSFHRAFLKLHRPELDPDTLPLRRVQQYVNQTLHLLAKEGKAKRMEEDFELERGAVPEFYRGRF